MLPQFKRKSAVKSRVEVDKTFAVTKWWGTLPKARECRSSKRF
jgi:hypothetical protein